MMKLCNALCLTCLFMGTVGITSASNLARKAEDDALQTVLSKKYDEDDLKRKWEDAHYFLDRNGSCWRLDNPFDKFSGSYVYFRGFKKECERIGETLFNTPVVNLQKKPKSPKTNSYSSLFSWIQMLKQAQKKYPKPSTIILETSPQDEQNQSEQNKE